MTGPVLFFDIGASLIEGPALAPARFLAKRLGLDDAARKRLDRRLLTTRLETPAALAALLIAEHHTGPAAATEAAEAVWQTQIDGPSAIDGAHALLARLRAQGVRYGFISNIWHPYAQSFARLFGPLAETDLSFFSYRIGIAKPDPALYHHALAAAGRAAADCIMIGDSYDNDMAPAASLGMRTLWLLHRPAKERRYLDDVERGVLGRPDVMVGSIADIGR